MRAPFDATRGNLLQAAGAAGSAAVVHAGLWVGNAVITNVSQPASFDPTAPKPTPSGFQFRLLIHLDAAGTPRLLREIIQMWKNGSYKPDAIDPSKQVVDAPGRFVLITDERFIPLIPNLTGATLRDGVPVGRRFSSAAFGFREPIPFAGLGQFGAEGSRFASQVDLPYDEELNPFKHRYHPDHNNYGEEYDQKSKLPEGVESFTISRLIELQFTANDPDDLRLAGWGDTQLGGIYRETITGLHKDPLYLQGNFRLHHASRIAVLNDGL